MMWPVLTYDILFPWQLKFCTIHSSKCLHSISRLTCETKIVFCKLTCSETYKEKTAKKLSCILFL